MVTMLKPRIPAQVGRLKPSAVRERLAGSGWMKLRSLVLRRNPLCVICQAADRLTPAVEVDHRTPIHRGGTDDLSNLQGLCKSRCYVFA